MCFTFEINTSARKIEERFKAVMPEKGLFIPTVFNGFTFPATPIICNNAPKEFKFYNWGLIPPWAKDDLLRAYTLNARVETLHEKSSFKTSINQRCLIPATSFFEWQWLDPKGKHKQKYEIELLDHELFAFAGLWSNWLDPATNEYRHTYTLITTEANELLSRIHNSSKRMPIVLTRQGEQDWLSQGKLQLDNDRLEAYKIE